MRRPSILLLLALPAVLLSGCLAQPTPAPAATLAPTVTPVPEPSVTPTPDPCAPENIQQHVGEIDRLMREFDDASLLAQNTPLGDLLLPAIAELQRIRREAEDQEIPACLFDLKSYQVAHMNTVIDVMIGFLNNADQELINQGAAQARELHDGYTFEMARLLGITLIPPTPEATPDGTTTPSS